MPTKDSTRLFSIFYELAAVLMFFVAVTMSVDDWTSAVRRKQFRESLETLPDIAKIPFDVFHVVGINSFLFLHEAYAL